MNKLKRLIQSWLVNIWVVLFRRKYYFKSGDGNFYVQSFGDRILFNFKRNSVSDSMNIVNYVYKNVKKGWVCMDVGACIGAISVPLWKKVGNKGKVYSIEADPSNINRLKENLILNKASSKGVFSLALYRKSGEVSLSLVEGINGWQSLGNHLLDKQVVKDRMKISKIKVIAETLDNFSRKNKIKHIDLLKIDTEGAEIDVLKGSRSMLKKNLIDRMIVEISPKALSWHKRKPEEIFSFLKVFDFQLFEIKKDGSLTSFNNVWPASKYGDILAIRKDLLKNTK